MDLRHPEARPTAGRARGRRRGARSARERLGRRAAPRRARRPLRPRRPRGAASGATCCCRRCTRSRPASAGSARARSTTSASGSPCRRPRPTASRPSTRCSRSRSRAPAVVHVCDDIACRLQGRRGALRASWRRRSAPPGRRRRRRRARPGCAAPASASASRRPPRSSPRAGEEPSTERRSGGATVPALARDAARPADHGASPATAAAAAPARSSASPACASCAASAASIPTSLDDYRAHGGYAGAAPGPRARARRASSARSPTSKLVGRGGAAFPTGRKWEAVARAPVRPHYLVCNADESRAGHLQGPRAHGGGPVRAGRGDDDRRPRHRLRARLPLHPRRVSARRRAPAAARSRAARARGFLGDDVMGQGFRFDIELRRGAGAYICGEETALFNSIEGFRGEPRNKPPFPVQVGLFGKPTVINNVETLVNVLDIVLGGGPAYAAARHARARPAPSSSASPATCARPGLYEVPFGTTLRELLELAGGVPAGRRSQAVLLGGAAGAFVTPDELDMPLTFEGTRALGATLGSGVVMVFDDTVDLWDIVLRIAAFFRDESCGQCVPCRVGHGAPGGGAASARSTAAARARVAQEMLLLEELGQVMRDASICGLGPDRVERRAARPMQQARPLERRPMPEREAAPCRPRPRRAGRAHDRRPRGAGARGHDPPRGLPRSRRSTRRRSATSRT